MFENHFLGVARHRSHGTTGKPGRFNQRAHLARAGPGDRTAAPRKKERIKSIAPLLRTAWHHHSANRPVGQAQGCSSTKTRWQNLALAARERLFWPISNEPRREPRSQTKAAAWSGRLFFAPLDGPDGIRCRSVQFAACRGPSTGIGL